MQMTPDNNFMVQKICQGKDEIRNGKRWFIKRPKNVNYFKLMKKRWFFRSREVERSLIQRINIEVVIIRTFET